MKYLLLRTFHQCVPRLRGEYKAKDFSCLDQYRCMVFGQCKMVRDWRI
ncbi:MAG: DUF4372 domain-containing protein [Desulfovibrionaceae bacterium]|nr:DUF4372 domain-containing protein [Desulfovibrionaceae bacterium]MBF0514707.1 DUF4372 domain-containing protein [Desulfovibrionaceae bacterium]